ncbi:MAG: hypothetical protein JSV70_09170 [bacterium]|nr:MAG: hypothetical protein JSV70_09170 [bacterium]
MKRSVMFLSLILVSVFLASVHAVYADEPAPLVLKKECVIIGRLLGVDVMLYPKEDLYRTDRPIPAMTRVKGFEILNSISGEWIPLSLSDDGYFCLNVGMGEYELRGRDSQGRPYLIHRFNVPLNMAVNLGTFWVETTNPKWVTVDPLQLYESTVSWRLYGEGAGHIAMRMMHETSRQAYEECEEWFAECHEEAYEHFEKVMARR